MKVKIIRENNIKNHEEEINKFLEEIKHFHIQRIYTVTEWVEPWEYMNTFIFYYEGGKLSHHAVD